MTRNIKCSKCGGAVKPLGILSVACQCASYTFDLDDIGAEAFSGWTASVRELLEILGARTEASETTLVFNTTHGGGLDYLSGRQPIERGNVVGIGDTIGIPSRDGLVVRSVELCASRFGSHIRIGAVDDATGGGWYSINELYVRLLKPAAGRD